MSTEDTLTGITRTKAGKTHRYHFDRHTRSTASGSPQSPRRCTPSARWRGPTPTTGIGWRRAAGRFELARCPHVSNDHDVTGEGTGYKGITIPTIPQATGVRGGMLEMDEPEHSAYRSILNPYLSPAAIKRWKPFVDEIVRASIDEKIETGRIDFVDDLANVVPAVLTLALMGVPLKKWQLYCEPAHANVYTPADSPDAPRVLEQTMAMGADLFNHLLEIREHPRPGIVDALARLRIDGEPAPDAELLGMLGLIIGGGFDTTTALTAHALEWLGENPEQRELLRRESDTLLASATEEFLRFFTPAPGTAARSPPISRSRARSSRRAIACGCPGRWPTAIPRCSPIRIDWTSLERTTGTSALV